MSTEQNLQKRKSWLLISGAVFAVLCLIYGLYWLTFGQFSETTDDAYVSGNLVQVMPKITGQITQIKADETDFVVKGQALILLNKADAFIALKQAESQLALTLRQISQLYANVEQFQANNKIAEQNLEKAKEDYQRRQGLGLRRTISIEDLQHSKIAYLTATSALASSQNQLQAALALIKNTDLYHHPQVLDAIVRFRNAYLNWLRTTIYAPETGYIAKRPVEIGEQVNPNTVLMIIVPLNQVWVNANFKESQLKYIRINQPAELISDIYGSAVKYRGKVVGLNPGAGNTFDLLPPQNATGNWIKIVQRLPVRIAIDTRQLAEHPLQIGLSMAVTINTRNRSGLILSKTPQTKVLFETKDDLTDLSQANALINKILQENSKNISSPSTQ